MLQQSFYITPKFMKEKKPFQCGICEITFVPKPK